MGIHNQQSNHDYRTGVMEHGQDQAGSVPSGERGAGYITPPRVPRDERTMSPSGVEEVLTFNSSLGESGWTPRTVHQILHEGGYERSRTTRVFRRVLGIMAGRYQHIIDELETENNIEEIYGLFEEAAAIEDTVHAITRRLDFTGEDSG
jgi:hypothetical protein